MARGGASKRTVRARSGPWEHESQEIPGCLQQSPLHTQPLHPSNVFVPWRNRDARWRKPSGSTLAPSRGLLAGWTVSSPPSIACPFSPAALTPARRKAGRADSGSSGGVSHQLPHAKEHLPGLSAGTERGAEGRGRGEGG